MPASEYLAARAIAKLYSCNRANRKTHTTKAPSSAPTTSISSVNPQHALPFVEPARVALLPGQPHANDLQIVQRTFPLPVADLVAASRGKNFCPAARSLPIYPRPYELYRRRPQLLATSYRAEAVFSYALFFLVRDDWLLGDDALAALEKVHPDFAAMIMSVPRLRLLDFSPLLEPLADFDRHMTIPPERVCLFAACAIHYGLDFGLVVCYLDGEFSAAHRDVPAILRDAAPLVPPGTLANMSRVLTQGCPAHLNWFETHANKEAFVRRGNHPAFRQHQQVVDKTLAKEVRHSHLIPLPRWFCTCSAYGHHVPQNILLKPGKKPRLIWDGKSKKFYHEVTTNEMTGTNDEEDILFGLVFMTFCIWIYNLRISYPSELIYLAFLDISACFRFPRVAPDLVGAFGFIVGPLYFLANAMVFGSIASASSWEPFRVAIAAIAVTLFPCAYLVERHHDLLR